MKPAATRASPAIETTVEVGDQPYRRSSAGATRSATKQAAATSMMSRCAGANPDEAGVEPVEPFE